ncbi:MAG: glycosyltransferase [Candidatus Peribacteraceae bacterium]|nr:glycosyltransferase [Candidatus Peribacteraceae bacterium]
MKLLMISGDRSILNGKQGAFYHMLEEFSKHWERIDIICPRIWGYSSLSILYQYQQKPLFGNVHFHPSSKGLLSQPDFIMKKGEELIKEHGHQVMTVHEYAPFYNGRGAKKLTKKTNIPYVLEIHHIVGYPKAASLAEFIGRIMSRIYMKYDVRTATQVRVVNHSMEKLLMRWGVPYEKISVVPSFYLDKEVARPAEKVDKRYDIAFCARLVKNKGLLEVIDALAGLSRVTLIVIGDGPLKQAAEKRVAALGMLERVTFTGWLPTQTEVMDAIQTARIFIQNSKSEGGPRVSLEAMACGMPVLTTRVGVMPDIVRDGYNGMFLSGDKMDIVIKVDHLLHDPPLRKAMGTNARDIINKFEKHTLLEKYALFVKSLALKPDESPSTYKAGTLSATVAPVVKPVDTLPPVSDQPVPVAPASSQAQVPAAAPASASSPSVAADKPATPPASTPALQTKADIVLPVAVASAVPQSPLPPPVVVNSTPVASSKSDIVEAAVPAVTNNPISSKSAAIDKTVTKEPAAPATDKPLPPTTSATPTEEPADIPIS